jgi:hypothetical protein
VGQVPGSGGHRRCRRCGQDAEQRELGPQPALRGDVLAPGQQQGALLVFAGQQRGAEEHAGQQRQEQHDDGEVDRQIGESEEACEGRGLGRAGRAGRVLALLVDRRDARSDV